MRRFNISDTSHPPENGDLYKSIHKLRGRFYRHKILVILIPGAQLGLRENEGYTINVDSIQMDSKYTVETAK